MKVLRQRRPGAASGAADVVGVNMRADSGSTMRLMTLARSGRLMRACRRGARRCTTAGFRVIEVKEFARAREVETGVGEEDLGRAAFDHRAQEIRVEEILAALRRQDHRGVALAPRLEGFRDVRLDGGVFGEAPRLVQGTNSFEESRRARHGPKMTRRAMARCSQKRRRAVARARRETSRALRNRIPAGVGNVRVIDFVVEECGVCGPGPGPTGGRC